MTKVTSLSRQIINYEERADISYECQEKNNSNSTGM